MRESHQSAMANIAVQRIKREFKEVLKSEEVCETLLDFIVAVRTNKRTPGNKQPEACGLA